MKGISAWFAFGLALVSTALAVASLAQAQAADRLQVRLMRQFGYQSGVRIQGSFRVRVEGPEDLAHVALYLDRQVIGVDDQAPFRFEFNTADYSPGEHTLLAQGIMRDGVELVDGPRRLTFLTAEQSWGAAVNLLVPTFILVGVLSLLAVFFVVVPGHKRTFQPGRYGAAGGAVCKRCALPFTRHLLAPNLLAGRLERCPHCKSWMIAGRASEAALRAAEERYSADAGEGVYQPSAGQEECFLQRLEDSRFEN